MQSTTVLNTDSFAEHSRQALVLSLFEGLNNGADFLVRTQLDPATLCRQLDQLQQPNLHWEFVEKSPGAWKIRISKRAPAAIPGGCCGMCGG